MSIQMKRWEDLTKEQKQHVVEMATAARIPMTSVHTSVFHTRGDFISGAVWEFMPVWGGWAGPDASMFCIVAAPTEDQARKLVMDRHGDCQAEPFDNMFTVAGETEARILRTIPGT